MTKPSVAVVDADMYKYTCAFAGETRNVLVEHPNGFSKKFKNRTEFYGTKKDNGKGILKLNAKRGESPFTYDEFTYTDVQKLKPFDDVIESTRNTIDRDLRKSGTTANKSKFFLGEGDSFRVERSTLLRYKGTRSGQIKPLLIDEISEFIRTEYSAEVVQDIECDDACVIEAYGKQDHFIIAEDKDMWGMPINMFDVNRAHRGIVNCNKFGKLFKDDKGKIRGEGRIHLYWQCLGQDSSDNYKANCFSDIKWGEVSSYNALVNCINDKEALQVMVDCFKMLYPAPKIITGWRGDNFEIDWLYVASEMFDMARMLRWEGDVVVLKDVLDKMEIKY